MKIAPVTFPLSLESFLCKIYNNAHTEFLITLLQLKQKQATIFSFPQVKNVYKITQ